MAILWSIQCINLGTDKFCVRNEKETSVENVEKSKFLLNELYIILVKILEICYVDTPLRS